MTHTYDPVEQPHLRSEYPDRNLAVPAPVSNSAVSWAAIFAGAVAAASLAMVLLMLGTGLGLSSISPWDDHGLSAGTVGIAAIAWLTFTQIVASGMGGYLAGRLRTKWVDTHVDEVYFRDTAHGFLTWAVAALISAVLLTTSLGSIVSGGAKAVGAVGSVAAGASALSVAGAAKGSSEVSNESMSYFINSLFRKTNVTADGQTNITVPPTQSVSPAQLGEVTGIFINSIGSGSLPPEDLNYIAQLVAQNTGLNQAQAEERVKSIYANVQSKLEEAKKTAKEAADTARKTTSYVTLWTFISLLIGAFVASLCATYGGRQRDL